MTQLIKFNVEYFANMSMETITACINNIIEEHNNIDAQLTSRTNTVEVQGKLIDGLKEELYHTKQRETPFSQLIKDMLEAELNEDWVRETVNDKVREEVSNCEDTIQEMVEGVVEGFEITVSSTGYRRR